MRQLFLIEIHQRALSCFVQANIGDMGQPPGRRFVQMLETGERAAVEQVGLQIQEGTFDFSFRFGPPRPAGDRPKAILGGKG